MLSRKRHIENALHAAGLIFINLLILFQLIPEPR